METSTKAVTGGKGHLRLTEILAAFHQKFATISVRNALPSEMFEYGVPYEAYRTYRIMKSEFECKKCEAMLEANRQALRGF